MGNPNEEMDELQKQFLQSASKPSSIFVTPTEKLPMDGATKATIWLFATVILLFAILFGIIAWGFIEFILWITSK